MTITRAIAALILVIAIVWAIAQLSRLNSDSRDRLSPGGDVSGYQDEERENIARHAEIVVRAGPTFAPGYVVGMMREGDGWKLVGRGNRAKGPEGPNLPQETSCSRPIGETLSRNSMALWSKALAAAGKTEGIGLDGEFFSFYLKSRNVGGSTWSPDARNQPRMYRLAQIADGLFEACLTGKDLDALNSQISELSAML